MCNSALLLHNQIDLYRHVHGGPQINVLKGNHSILWKQWMPVRQKVLKSAFKVIIFWCFQFLKHFVNQKNTQFLKKFHNRTDLTIPTGRGNRDKGSTVQVSCVLPPIFFYTEKLFIKMMWYPLEIHWNHPHQHFPFKI